MNASEQPEPPPLPRPARRSRTAYLVVAAALAAAVVFAAAALWGILFPRAFRPVELRTQERETLEAKLDLLDSGGRPGARGGPPGGLEPERYREDEAGRTVRLTERELNFLLAKNTDLASRLALRLSENLLSAKLLVPLDEDFPVLGGKVVKVTAGIELAFAEGRPRVVLKGISLMGVPIPNAWLGGVKNIDLVREFGAREGFWQAFAAGVEDLRVEEGALLLRLEE